MCQALDLPRSKYSGIPHINLVSPKAAGPAVPITTSLVQHDRLLRVPELALVHLASRVAIIIILALMAVAAWALAWVERFGAG